MGRLWQVNLNTAKYLSLVKPCTELSGYIKVNILINIAAVPQTYGVYLKTANKLPRIFRHSSATNFRAVGPGRRTA